MTSTISQSPVFCVKRSGKLFVVASGHIMHGLGQNVWSPALVGSQVAVCPPVAKPLSLLFPERIPVILLVCVAWSLQLMTYLSPTSY